MLRGVSELEHVNKHSLNHCTERHMHAVLGGNWVGWEKLGSGMQSYSFIDKKFLQSLRMCLCHLDIFLRVLWFDLLVCVNMIVFPPPIFTKCKKMCRTCTKIVFSHVSYCQQELKQLQKAGPLVVV